ncbi:PdxA family dehydrogenase [Segatella albensis]|uniref:PdxA family dehydrogenase n=1 Tax=Segatella albensis TaxID=77768 RepID=UPI000414CA0F|nr:4-hydroxythreonine-4-phosphate dehydrogenase PdxA [Segatella albensis]
MEENNKIRVAITHGDTNGIGYELIFKTFAEPEMLEICTPIIYGSPKAAAYHRNVLDIQANFSIINSAEEARDGRINLLPTYDEETKIDMGIATPESGTAALKALDRAMGDYRNGLFDVLVTAPINKANIKGEGFEFKGNAKYIETCIGEGQKAFPILVNEQIRLASVTENIPLKDVANAITKEALAEKATIFFNTLRRDFNISNPRIAVLALNPSTNEDGTFGKEETEVIIPTINELVDKGVETFGPYAADEFFGNGYYQSFDGILAMYHDQGTAPFKTIAPESGVVYLANLPAITTASDMTVDYENAGKCIESPDSFRHAVYLAIDSFNNRHRYDEPLTNPLKKLYHEKRDESEKNRFAIPKKHSGDPFPPKEDKHTEKKEAQKK